MQFLASIATSSAVLAAELATTKVWESLYAAWFGWGDEFTYKDEEPVREERSIIFRAVASSLYLV
jgi:hypothetical protein